MQLTDMKTIKRTGSGFTLIEMLVSLSVFSLVMLVATGAVFTIVESNKKTHSLKSVMTNLNFALESMARDMRVGLKYNCGTGGDCQSGGTVFRYKANREVDGDGFYNADDATDQIEYSLEGGRIQKRILGGSNAQYYITAQEINITSLKFYVTGTGVNDGKQPKVVMTVQGSAGVGKTKSEFNIQTTITQRSIDS